MMAAVVTVVLFGLWVFFGFVASCGCGCHVFCGFVFFLVVAGNGLQVVGFLFVVDFFFSMVVVVVSGL